MQGFTANATRIAARRRRRKRRVKVVAATHPSVYYLQCSLTDGVGDWPDQRIRDEIRLRLGDASIDNAIVHEKVFVPLRSVIHFPMQHGRLFLAGDAADLVPPAAPRE